MSRNVRRLNARVTLESLARQVNQWESYYNDLAQKHTVLAEAVIQMRERTLTQDLLNKYLSTALDMLIGKGLLSREEITQALKEASERHAQPSEVRPNPGTDENASGNRQLELLSDGSSDKSETSDNIGRTDPSNPTPESGSN